MVKRQIGGDAAGAYAAAAVAAKAVVWVAIGIGLYLLPEATRAARRGAGPAAGPGPCAGRRRRRRGADADRLRGCAPETVLRLAFGAETVIAADALFVLGCAMTLLAVGYLGVQYMLALGRVAFLPALGGRGRRGDRAARRARDRVAARRSPRSCSWCRPRPRCRCSPSASLAPVRRPATRALDRRLAHRGAGGAAGGPRSRSAAAGRGRRDRLVPRALDSRARARRGRGGRDRPARAAATAARRRSRRTRSSATRTTPRLEPTWQRPAWPSGCATCASGPRRRTATWTARSRCCSSTAPTGSGPPGPTGRVGRARAPGGDDARPRRVLVRRRDLGAVQRRAWGRARGATRAGRAAWPSTSALPRGRVPTWLRQLGELPWFARNLAIKALVVAGRRRWAERLGLDPAAPWPY